MIIDSRFDARVREYLHDEPSGGDRAILSAWLDSGDADALTQAFGDTIAFGTAGLRGLALPGPSNVNVRTVRLATRGLLEVLEKRVPDAKARGISVGFDARPSSAELAANVRAVASAAGFHVMAFAAPVPTPLVAFAAHERQAAAAVVITASHNPPQDNGMKVYGPDAGLIVAPWDTEIASLMFDGRKSPCTTTSDDATIESVEWLGSDVAARHRARCLALGGAVDSPRRAQLRVAYTALHGVGAAYVESALAELGNVEFHSVASQHAPDGTFPTVRAPNPEEPSAMALVLALASEVSAELVLATDPDADRLAVGVRSDGAVSVLHGDELGVLFGEALMTRAHPPSAVVLNTIVSSPWMLDIARALNVASARTLTGHKWIHARALELARSGREFLFGYEEAIGYAFANGVRDKDGIAAAVLITRLAGELRQRDRTLMDELERISRTYGAHRSRSLSIRLNDGSGDPLVNAVMLRALQRDVPAFPGYSPAREIDGRHNVVRDVDGSEALLGLPASSLRGVEFAEGLRLLMRPSGTEPKLKVYIDLPFSLRPEESYLAARARCDETLAAIERTVRSLFGDEAAPA